MKKLIALLIAVMMIATMIPAMAISTSAADGEQATPATGDWDVYRFANEYPSEDDDPEEEYTYKGTAGYTYTNEGFSVIGADYTDTTPSITIQSTTKINLKEGVYLQFRVDDYSYDGGTGADQWICPSLTTDKMVAPGSTAYGGGWLSLIRGSGNGNATVLPHLTNPKTEEFGGTFTGVGTANVTVPMDDDGREIYTWEIKWDGSAYNMFMNGVEIPGAAQATALLNQLDANGDFYVGVSAQAGVKDGTAAFTILKFGTSEADATVPTGTDSRDPEPNGKTVAPIIDSNTVEANTPAINWNPEDYKLKAGNNVTFTVQGDNTWKAVASDALVFWQFTPKNQWSYDAVDFPVFGIMLRNAWFESGVLWYAAGEVMSPQNDCILPFSIYDDGEFFGEDDEYVFVPVDISDLWEGRINSVRLDFNLTEDQREFEVCFAGMFRSDKEAYAYCQTWLADNTDVATGIETDAPTEPDVDDETNAPVGGDETTAVEDVTTAGGDDAAQGCASIVGMGAVAILAAAAAAVALKKKD